jgi:Flp pilus assembly pilin Flp
MGTRRLIPGWKETVMDLFMKFTFDEAGASAVEYALLLAFIASVIIGSVSTLGLAVKGLFERVVF